MHKLALFALFAVILTTTTISAQNPSIEIGPAAGVVYYNGDLNTVRPFLDLKPAFGLLARYSNSNRWAYRLSYLNGEIHSKGMYPRNDSANGISFNAPFNEVNLVAEFNFFEFEAGSNRNKATNYIFAGLGLTFPDTSLVPPLNLAFGLGFKYSISRRFSLGIEWGMRRLFDDSIDHLSNQSENNWPFWDDRGVGDWYNFTGITITYKGSLKRRVPCDAYQGRIIRKYQK